MSDKLWKLNTLFAVVDTLICLAAIVAFSFMAYHFDKWWIVLFDILPLLLFNSHTLVVDTELRVASEGGEKVE